MVPVPARRWLASALPGLSYRPPACDRAVNGNLARTERPGDDRRRPRPRLADTSALLDTVAVSAAAPGSRSGRRSRAGASRPSRRRRRARRNLRWPRSRQCLEDDQQRHDIGEFPPSSTVRPTRTTLGESSSTPGTRTSSLSTRWVTPRSGTRSRACPRPPTVARRGRSWRTASPRAHGRARPGRQCCPQQPARRLRVPRQWRTPTSAAGGGRARPRHRRRGLPLRRQGCDLARASTNDLYGASPDFLQSELFEGPSHLQPRRRTSTCRNCGRRSTGPWGIRHS